MKFIYVTDLHGDKRKYDKLFELCKRYNIDLIINGGDLLPKNDNRPVVQPKFLKEYYIEFLVRLEVENIDYISMMGNDDLDINETNYHTINNCFSNVYEVDNKKIKYKDFEIIGMNYTLDSPFPVKDHVVTEENFVPEEQPETFKRSIGNSYMEFYGWSKIRDELPHMIDILEDLPKPDDYRKTIFLTHIPPAHLDLGHVKNLPRLVGSNDIYKFFKKNQPYLTLHGHLHENYEVGGKWINKIDETICIQPGQREMFSDEMVFVLIDTDKNEFKRIIEKL